MEEVVGAGEGEERAVAGMEELVRVGEGFEQFGE